MSLCDYSNVQILTSPSVLKLLDSQRYLWLSYDIAEVIKLIAVTFKQKMCCFISKKNTLCHSALVSFLLDYSHSFGISVIPSGFLSLLPDYCHSFGISVIYSELLPFQIFVIPNNCGTLPHELLPLDSNVRAKIAIMLKIKKFSKSFFLHIGNIK